MAVETKVTLDMVIQAVEEDDNSGFCLACGDQTYGIEPDAHEYTCESCGEPKVYGAEELLFMLS